jgi:Amt family ammonium transporter
VVGVHLVGGLIGTIGVGFLASAAAPAGVDGLFYGGGVDQLWRQVVGALSVMVFSFVMTYLIGLVIEKTMGFRLEQDAEVAGIDLEEHAESGYDISGVTGGRFGSGAVTTSTTAPGAKTHEGASA